MKRQVPWVDGDGQDAEASAAHIRARTARPPAKRHPELLTLSTGPSVQLSYVVQATDARPSMRTDVALPRNRHAFSTIISANERRHQQGNVSVVKLKTAAARAMRMAERF